MNTPFTISLDFGRVEIRSWIDFVKQPDGSAKAIGMGSKTVIEPDGRIRSHEAGPTGLVGKIPA